MTVPAAFNHITGAAHWETLLRARAIETGCFVLAPAQTGFHPETDGKGRRTHGHSLAIAPWGEVLADAGLENVVTASSSADALNRLKNFTPGIAILDINLGRDTSVPVAEELVRRGIPFVFATGYDDRSVVPDELLSIPVVRKPYDASALVKALSDRLQDS